MEVINGVLTGVKDSDIVNGTFIFPEGVKKIDNFAFSGCKSLENIVIPGSVKEICREIYFISKKYTNYHEINQAKHEVMNCYNH